MLNEKAICLLPVNRTGGNERHDAIYLYDTQHYYHMGWDNHEEA